MAGQSVAESINVPPAAADVLAGARSVRYVGSVEELVELAVPETDERGYWTVGYDVPGRGFVTEARVGRVKNGVAVNYAEPYMRRRDPDCMVIADDRPTNKPTYESRFGGDFEPVREQTFEWLRSQDLVCFFFTAGMSEGGLASMAICPANAGFFGLGLAMLQGIVPLDKAGEWQDVKAIVYIAPPMRHTHFGGRQVVVHNRRTSIHELFSYNLYPGPSAKKGVYGMLLNVGEREGWVTAHCSTVNVVTPYDNVCTIMHEGASGGGKSEMLEYMHREDDGRLRLGRNTVTDEVRHLALPRGCRLHPVTDDMALCHPSFQTDGSKKLSLRDAESAWFVRVNHIARYGTDPHLEALTVQPPEPLLFLNVDATPGSTALIWEHVEDEPGQRCPNPRVVIPRKMIPDIIDGTVSVDVRSFGVRTPPCTRERPSYGILGMFHLLPPALAWLWRLVAPRGHGNPSIVSKDAGMSSEGVGSYWPFATGRRVDHANLLLEQIMETTDTQFVLMPNQHIGAWEVGFAPQWVAREYLARRGHAPFRRSAIEEARCPLLGYAMKSIQVEGSLIASWLLRTETQPEVGEEGYDAGAKILERFFADHLKGFLDDEIDEVGRRIIQCCLDGGAIGDYEAFAPTSHVIEG